jgi:lysophospholipase L1-like esterase
MIGWDGAPTPTFGIDFYRQVADAYTSLVCDLAPTYGAKCADFLHVFNGPDGTDDAAALLEPDHLHPSQAGRERIADVLMAVGLEPLGP